MVDRPSLDVAPVMPFDPAAMQEMMKDGHHFFTAASFHAADVMSAAPRFAEFHNAFHTQPKRDPKLSIRRLGASWHLREAANSLKNDYCTGDDDVFPDILLRGVLPHARWCRLLPVC